MRTIEWINDHIDVVDQTALPELRRIQLRTVDDVVDAIQRMVVRGAPALGVLGALGVALSARYWAAHGGTTGAEVHGRHDAGSRHGLNTDAIYVDAERLAAARPTAVSLSWAVEAALESLVDGPHAVLANALELLEEDVRRCEALSRRGAKLLRYYLRDEPLVLATHCNTGAMAAVDWGTALGVIRALHDDGLVRLVLVGETRPLLQGSRITATELSRMDVEHRVIIDSAGPALIASGRVHAVIVGADRIAANFDVVNKIGTYSLALAAKRAGIPFVVAAPEATIDAACPYGAAVPIEQRSAEEILLVGGWRMAPVDSEALNPAFDVTPSDLVSAIVTESRVIEPNVQPR